MDLQKLDEQFEAAASKLNEDNYVLETYQEMHKLMKMFYQYLEEKYDGA